MVRGEAFDNEWVTTVARFSNKDNRMVSLREREEKKSPQVMGMRLDWTGLIDLRGRPIWVSLTEADGLPMFGMRASGRRVDPRCDDCCLGLCDVSDR